MEFVNALKNTRKIKRLYCVPLFLGGQFIKENRNLQFILFYFMICLEDKIISNFILGFV